MFDPAMLACKAAGTPDCLTAEQVENARSAYAPVTRKDGALVYPGRSPGFESGWRIPTPGAPVNPLFADMPRYVGRQDPNWDPMTFELETDLALALKNGGFIEATNPDLARFKARGGKLLLYHGWADPGPAPENTVNYFEAVIGKLGGQQDDWMRLFLMPGVGHCGGGVGPDQADFLGALERWREQGVAPGHVIATRPAGPAGQPPSPEGFGGPGPPSPEGSGGPRSPLSRPLCPYPQVARHTGSGSTDEAKNFRCVAP
jgi:feruloyl esterase